MSWSYRLWVFCILFFSAVGALGQELITSVTPSSGPASGGTRVTIKGNFAGWPYGVIFGQTGAMTERIDDHTLIATTPPHLPGTVPIVLFEYDVGIVTRFTFTFEGSVPEQFERLLLPVFVPPADGAFGSRFHTELRLKAKQPASVRIFGIQPFCPIENCTWNFSVNPIELRHRPNGYQPAHFIYFGNPGRFIYVLKDDVAKMAANLRVYDSTRSAFNFGTEVPIVRSGEFATRIVLQGVPANPRFRNTLRIYSAARAEVTITIGDHEPMQMTLQNGANIFDPFYASFGDFPVGIEPVNVTIDSETPIWALVSVTNNDTQLISTITP